MSAPQTASGPPGMTSGEWSITKKASIVRSIIFALVIDHSFVDVTTPVLFFADVVNFGGVRRAVTHPSSRFAEPIRLGA